jgi:RNA polymerase sigma-70 factor, ECF subfamily
MASVTGERFSVLAQSVDPQPVTASPDTTGVESRLVDAAREGDRAAFGRLYDRYARMVHGILLARVPFSEVDDLVHDAFLQALRRLHTLRDSARFGAWLAAIARNLANDYHRRSVEQVELPEDLSEDRAAGAVRRDRGARATDDALAKEKDEEKDEEARFLLAAIQELPETYREPLLLRLVEGMTGPEIAAQTGLTHGSVRVTLHRGMQQLREKLAGLRTPRAPEST